MQKLLKLILVSLLYLGILQSNVSAVDTTQQTAFIERFYQNIMNRTADEGGMATWLDVIQNESAAKVALGFFKSQEFINKDLSNPEFVDILYTTLFDRQADYDGRTDWLNKLNNNLATKDEVMYGFFNAQEFANLANRFGVTQIRAEDQLNAGTTGVDGYVNRFYSLVLNRTADDSGFVDWTTQLNAGTKGGGDIAKGFFNSQEYLNRGLDNSTFLDICYRAFFDREADEGGKSNWTTLLDQAGTVDEVLNGFIGSQEFIALASRFGIEAGTVDSSSNGVNYVENLNMTAEDVIAMFFEPNLAIEYSVPGNVVGTFFNNHFVGFFDPAGLYISIDYDWQNSTVDNQIWDIELEEFTASELLEIRPVVLNSTTYREKYDDGGNEECAILSTKKVNSILDITVDAIEIQEFCSYGRDDDYGVGEGWSYSGYHSTYSTITDFLNQLQDFGIGDDDIQLTSDNKVKIKSTGEVIPNSSWKIEDGVLKTKYWDEVWYKLGTDDIIVDNWIGDRGFKYIGVTKEQAQQITVKMGLPVW